MASLCRRNRAESCRSAVSERRSRLLGFTLIEVMIYMAVLAVIAIPIVGTALAISRSVAEGNMTARILERNRAAGHRIAGDFRRSITGTMSVTNAGKTLQFTLPGGFNGTGAAVGDVIQYNIVDDPGDPTNGTDDNNNGVIDEKILTRTNVTTSETVTIGAYFNDVDSGFVVNGNGVTCTLTTVGWTKGSPNVTKVQHATDFFPRN